MGTNFLGFLVKHHLLTFLSSVEISLEGLENRIKIHGRTRSWLEVFLSPSTSPDSMPSPPFASLANNNQSFETVIGLSLLLLPGEYCVVHINSDFLFSFFLVVVLSSQGSLRCSISSTSCCNFLFLIYLTQGFLSSSFLF